MFFTDQGFSSAIIQDAINSLPSTGGVVYIEPGIYTISTKVTIPSNVSIIGEGITTILQAGINLNDHIFQNSDTTNGNSNIVIKNLKIDGNKANQSVGVGLSDAVNFTKVTSGICKELIIINTKGSGFDFTGSKFQVIDCSVDSPAEHGAVFRATTDDIYIRGGEYSNSSNQGISFENCTNVIVDATRSHDNTKNGISGIIVKQARFVNNWLYSNSQSGLDVEQLENFVIANNYSYNNTLSGIVAEQYPTVYAPSRNGTISANTTYLNGWAGIIIQEVVDVAIVGNVGWNNSRTTPNIGAMIHIKYDTGSAYDATHRCLRCSIIGNVYEDTRSPSTSTYAYAMNGSDGVNAGGNYLGFIGNLANGSLTSNIRIIADSGSDNNWEVGNL